MDSFEVVTYFIAGLGVIVLSLCIVVAGILIYQYCRSVTRLNRDLRNSRLECLTVSAYYVKFPSPFHFTM